MNTLQKKNHEEPVLLINTVCLDVVLCTSATTINWNEEETYSELD